MEKEEKKSAEISVYQNTRHLLKEYRDMVWEAELAARQICRRFQVPYEGNLEEVFNCLSTADAALEDKDIREQMEELRRINQIQKSLREALEILRTRHKNGELYYWILYYSYLSPQQFSNLDEVLEALHAHAKVLSSRTYYRRRREAVKALGEVMQ